MRDDLEINQIPRMTFFQESVVRTLDMIKYCQYLQFKAQVFHTVHTNTRRLEGETDQEFLDRVAKLVDNNINKIDLQTRPEQE